MKLKKRMEQMKRMNLIKQATALLLLCMLLASFTLCAAAQDTQTSDGVQTDGEQTTLALGDEALGITAPLAYNAYLSKGGNDDVLGVRFALPGAVRRLVALPAETLLRDYGLTKAEVSIQLDVSMTDENHYTYADFSGNDTDFVPVAMAPYDTAVQIYDKQEFLKIADEMLTTILGTSRITKTEKGVTSVSFDSANATLFSRVRFAVATVNEKGDSRLLVSDWSNGFAVGKAAGTVADISTFAPPAVSDAAIIGEDETADRTLVFSMMLSDSVHLSDMYRYLNRKSYVEAVAVISINGKETTYPLNGGESALWDGDYAITVLAGSIPANAIVGLKVYLTGDAGLWRTDDSSLLSLKLQPSDAPVVDSNGVVVTKAAEEELQTTDENKCPVCGFCPHPFGICIFLMIGAVLIVLLAIYAVSHMLRVYEKKECPRCHTKCDPKEKICPSCGYRFTTILPLVDDEEEERRSKKLKAESVTASPNAAPTATARRADASAKVQNMKGAEITDAAEAANAADLAEAINAADFTEAAEAENTAVAANSSNTEITKATDHTENTEMPNADAFGRSEGKE